MTVMSLWSLSSARTPSRTSKLSSATTTRRPTNSYDTRERGGRSGNVDGQPYDLPARVAAESIRVVDPGLLLRLEHDVAEILTGDAPEDVVFVELLGAIGSALRWPVGAVWRRMPHRSCDVPPAGRHR